MSVPAVQTDPMADFQAKLKERVRNDIRDLLPDEAVAELVKKAVEEEFFKPRMVERQHGYGKEERASWFVEEVVKAAKPMIAEAIRKWCAERHPAVEEVIVNFLDANKLAAATTSELTAMLAGCIMSLQQTMQNRR